MNVVRTELPGVLVVEPAVHGDLRGYLLETYHAERYREHGIEVEFVQDNLSRSDRGTLRGLHLQHPTDQAKLVYAVEGEILDVAVDVRVGSPTFGHHVSVVLDDKEKRQLVVPIGFAHGFLVRSEHALVAYKCSAPFAPRDAIDIAWNDPAIGIDWGTDSPTLSDKDAKAPRLDDVRERLPRFKGER